MDRTEERIERCRYEFAREGVTTAGLKRNGNSTRPGPRRAPSEIVADHQPEEYLAMVETVREGMRLGEYYEVVLRQTFQANFSDSPSELFERIQLRGPVHTNSFCNWATSNSWAPRLKCSCWWRANALKLVPSPAPRC